MLAGDLSDFALREVLRLLADGRKTGTVHLERDGTDARIAMSDGHVVTAAVGTAEAADGGHDVVDVVERLLGWREGIFRFERYEAVGDPESAAAGFAVDDLLARAATRAERLAALIEVQGSADAVVRLSDTESDVDLAVSPTAWSLIVAVGDGRTVADLVAASTYPELELRELLADLMARGLVVSSAHEQVPTASLDDPRADAGADEVAAEPAVSTASVDDGHSASSLGPHASDTPSEHTDETAPDAEGTADSNGKRAVDTDADQPGVDASVLARVVRGLEAR